MWELPKHKCEQPKCFKFVGEVTAKWSIKKYGKIYCYNHRPVTIKEATASYQTASK